MDLEVYWLEFAENKLEDIFHYYSLKANRNLALKLINGIINSTIGLQKQPKIGAIEKNLKHRKQEFRYLVYKNYKIIYWINYSYNRIEIVNVFDTRQDPNKIHEIR